MHVHAAFGRTFESRQVMDSSVHVHAVCACACPSVHVHAAFGRTFESRQVMDPSCHLLPPTPHLPPPASAPSTLTYTFETRQVMVRNARTKELEPRTEDVVRSSLTKYAALLDQLDTLRQLEPSYRAVIFTRFDEVQRRLVRMLKVRPPRDGLA